jgi:hypothetical protein
LAAIKELKMDLGTGLTVLGTALGGKDIIVKMLGPTAEYIGEGLKNFAEKRVQNVKNIFQNASKKLGDKIETDGTIPPKVLKGTLNEGSYAEDFLSVDYFGGVLASSRTGISRDDRGAFFNALISRLSTYQLRMHYVFYHAIKQTFNGENINWGLATERNKMRLYIPLTSFIKALDFTEREIKNISIYMDHIVNGLLREQLIDNWFQYGNLDHMIKHYKDASESGLLLEPNRLGFELFYWAYGLGQENPKDFLKIDKQFELDEKVLIDNGFKRITAVNQVGN